MEYSIEEFEKMKSTIEKCSKSCDPYVRLTILCTKNTSHGPHNIP